MGESELFVVRIWRQLASDFRASVRRVDEDQTHHFSNPEEVARFLCATTHTGGGPMDAAGAIGVPSVNAKD